MVTTLRYLIEGGGVGVNGGLEKFKKPNRQGSWNRQEGWKMIQNAINRVLGVWNQQRCSNLSASNTTETKETVIIEYYMQILQILIKSISKTVQVLLRILKSCHSNALVSQHKFTTLIQIGVGIRMFWVENFWKIN